jgi:hypothetical protein
LHLWKYQSHRSHAKARGISFNLTFEQWLKIWTDSGHLSERGNKAGQYVMARFQDRGAYAVGNVRIITVEENKAEHRMSIEGRAKISAAFTDERKKAQSERNTGSKHPGAKLTEAQVTEIRSLHVSGARPTALGRRFGVSRDTIQDIVNRRNWTHI